MIHHDQNRIIAMGEGKVGDEIHGNLLKGAGALGRDGGKQGVCWIGVNLIGLAGSTASNEFADEGGHAQPPIVLLEHRDGVEVTAVGASKGFMDIFLQVSARPVQEYRGMLCSKGHLGQSTSPPLGSRGVEQCLRSWW